MPIIDTKNNLPGMGGLIMYRKETGIPLAQFVDAVLTGNSELSRYERELICAYISFRNNCEYCFKSHTALAAKLSEQTNEELISLFENVKNGEFLSRSKSTVMLEIAENIRINYYDNIRHLSNDAIKHGFSEQAIHDIVLTASLICMFNRYVDGLEARLPDNEGFYAMIADKIAIQGYSMAGRM